MTTEQIVPNILLFFFFVSMFWFLLLTHLLSFKRLILPFLILVSISIYLFVSNSSHGRYYSDVSQVPQDEYIIIAVNLDISGPVPFILQPRNSKYYRYYLVEMNESQKEDLKKKIHQKGGEEAIANGDVVIDNRDKRWGVDSLGKYIVPKEYENKNEL